MVDWDSQWTKKKGIPEPFLELQSSDEEDVAAAGESHLFYLSQEGELHTTCGPWSSEVRLVWLCKNKKADSWSKVFY